VEKDPRPARTINNKQRRLNRYSKLTGAEQTLVKRAVESAQDETWWAGFQPKKNQCERRESPLLNLGNCDGPGRVPQKKGLTKEVLGDKARCNR